MGLLSAIGLGKRKTMRRGTTYRNALTAEIEKYLTDKYSHKIVCLSEVGDVNFNLDIVFLHENEPIGRVKRDPTTGYISYVGLFTGVTAEIRCFTAEAEQDHLFDSWLHQPVEGIPNPLYIK